MPRITYTELEANLGKLYTSELLRLLDAAAGVEPGKMSSGYRDLSIHKIREEVIKYILERCAPPKDIGGVLFPNIKENDWKQFKPEELYLLAKAFGIKKAISDKALVPELMRATAPLSLVDIRTE